MDSQPTWMELVSEHFRSQPVFGTLSTFIIAFVVVKAIVSIVKKRGQPPGPIGLPIVGYFPFLPQKDTHKYLHELGKKYGPIYSLKLGSYDAVVINSYEAFKESGRMDSHANRPPHLFTWSDSTESIGEMNGAPWKEQRRFITSTLRNIGMSQLKVEYAIKEQISLFLERLMTKTGDVDFNVRDILQPATNNIIMSLICGKTYDPNHKIIRMLNEFQFDILCYFELTRFPFFFPIIDRLYRRFSGELRRIGNKLLTFENFLREEIKEHEEQFQQDNKKDYIDHFLEEIQNNKQAGRKTTFTMPSLLGNGGLLLMAGSETVRSSIEWTMLCMARHQLTQEMIYKQIIDVLGPEKTPEFKDRERLPLVHALILEIMRFKTLVALNDPHWSTEDTVIMGFKIPKETFLWLNIWSVHNDEDYWGDPENFRPERFLSQDYKTVVNFERVIPFGVGKRSCPGDKLGEVEVFLFVTSLLQKFRILPPEKGVSMEEDIQLTTMVVSPLIRVQLR